MITNTRLTELYRVANQCQKMVDKKCATILEQDYVDLYCLARDHMIADGRPTSIDPCIKLLFGK